MAWWSRFVDGQVKEAIERPRGFALTTVLWGFMAGMQLSELLHPSFYGHRNNVFDYFLSVWIGVLPVWPAYCLTKAIRQLRGNKVGADTATE